MLSYDLMKKIFLIIFFALILKIIFLFSIYKYDPLLKIPQLDSSYYLKLALDLKKGKIIPEPEKFYLLSPGYSYFLAFISFKEGNYLNIYLIQIILGTISIFLIYKLGSKIFGERTGFFSSFLLIFYGPATFYEVHILSESILVFFLLLFFLLFFSKKKIFQILSGIILGYLCLLRQNLLHFWVF